MTPRKCAHRACECEIDRASSNFCSVYCEEDAKGIPREEGMHACRCGHAGCRSVDPHVDEEDREQHV